MWVLDLCPLSLEKGCNKSCMVFQSSYFGLLVETSVFDTTGMSNQKTDML